MMSRRAKAMALLFFMAAAMAYTQDSSAVSPLPEPYTADEFPAWATGLRRFEIISLGAFPIMLFYTRFGSDLTRYIKNDFDAYYAPWPFKSEYTYEATDEEQMLSVYIAGGLSLVFGAADALLLHFSTRKSP